jgi:hypothetical protein
MKNRCYRDFNCLDILIGLRFPNILRNYMDLMLNLICLGLGPFPTKKKTKLDAKNPANG